MKMHPYLAKRGPVLTMAHRGGGGLAPENTLVAFQQAVDLGMDVLETDIHSTADGVLVVSHDPTVERMTDGQGAIQHHTLVELKQLDAGYRWSADGGQTFPFRGHGHTIPTLEELFDAFPQARINIDIKQAAPSIVAPFCRLIQEYARIDRVLVGSFHTTTIDALRRALPEVITAASLKETNLFYLLQRLGLARFYRPPAAAFQVPADYGPFYRLTPGFIAAARRHGIEVHIWTVNEIAAMRRFIHWGAAGIITDYPDRLLSVLGGV